MSTFMGFHFAELYGSRKSRTEILYPASSSGLPCFSYNSFFGSVITRLGFVLQCDNTAMF